MSDYTTNSTVNLSINGKEVEEKLDKYQKTADNNKALSGRLNVMNKKAELLRSFKFLVFSVSAGVIEIVSFALLDETLGWPYWPCYLIALILSVLWNFTLNRKFTFRSANNVNVSEICQSLGGGGHAKAAGCSMTGELEEIKKLLVETVERALSR